MAARLVLWDIDGTLLHCGSDGKIALNRTFREKYGIEEAFDQAPIGGAMDAVILQRILAAFDLDEAELPGIIGHYSRVLEEVLAGDGMKRVLPGVRQILGRIHRHPTARNALLTSNLRVGAETKLRALELDGYFEIGGFGDHPGEKWDAARHCIAEAERLYARVFSPAEIVLIGDSVYDVACARELGAVSIAVATGWAAAEELRACGPDHFFEDLSDTEAVAAALGL